MHREHMAHWTYTNTHYPAKYVWWCVSKWCFFFVQMFSSDFVAPSLSPLVASAHHLLPVLFEFRLPFLHMVMACSTIQRNFIFIWNHLIYPSNCIMSIALCALRYVCCESLMHAPIWWYYSVVHFISSSIYVSYGFSFLRVELTHFLNDRFILLACSYTIWVQQPQLQLILYLTRTLRMPIGKCVVTPFHSTFVMKLSVPMPTTTSRIYAICIRNVSTSSHKIMVWNI